MTITPQQTLSRQRNEFIRFANARGIVVDKYTDWRCIEPRHGEIQGLPGSRGRLVATNGILCYIERSNQPLFIGHIAWFVTDKDEKSLNEDGVVLHRHAAAQKVFDMLFE